MIPLGSGLFSHTQAVDGVKVRAHVYVSGMVQGVFFRGETANLAHNLGLAGWVRNLSDGRVEAIFEGEKEKVEKAIAFCRHGPRGAYVQNLDLEWEEWTGEFRNFRVIY
jgi:acylphosphatase